MRECDHSVFSEISKSDDMKTREMQFFIASEYITACFPAKTARGPSTWEAKSTHASVLFKMRYSAAR